MALKAFAGAMLASCYRDPQRLAFWQRVAECDPADLDFALRGVEVAPSLNKAAQDEFSEAVAEAMCRRGYSRPADVAQLDIRGEFLATPAEFLASLSEAKAVHLIVDSPGGDCRAAERLLSALQKASTSVVVEIIKAGSASALLACCAPGRRVIRPAGSIMLHSPAMAVYGGAKDLRRVATHLESYTEEWVDRLVARTGQPAEVCRVWLGDKDVTFNAEAALELGLADAVG